MNTALCIAKRYVPIYRAQALLKIVFHNTSRWGVCARPLQGDGRTRIVRYIVSIIFVGLMKNGDSNFGGDRNEVAYGLVLDSDWWLCRGNNNLLRH